MALSLLLCVGRVWGMFFFLFFRAVCSIFIRAISPGRTHLFRCRLPPRSCKIYNHVQSRPDTLYDTATNSLMAESSLRELAGHETGTRPARRPPDLMQNNISDSVFLLPPLSVSPRLPFFHPLHVVTCLMYLVLCTFLGRGTNQAIPSADLFQCIVEVLH